MNPRPRPRVRPARTGRMIVATDAAAKVWVQFVPPNQPMSTTYRHPPILTWKWWNGLVNPPKRSRPRPPRKRNKNAVIDVRKVSVPLLRVVLVPTATAVTWSLDPTTTIPETSTGAVAARLVRRDITKKVAAAAAAAAFPNESSSVTGTVRMTNPVAPTRLRNKGAAEAERGPRTRATEAKAVPGRRKPWTGRTITRRNPLQSGEAEALLLRHRHHHEAAVKAPSVLPEMKCQCRLHQRAKLNQVGIEEVEVWRAHLVRRQEIVVKVLSDLRETSIHPSQRSRHSAEAAVPPVHRLLAIAAKVRSGRPLMSIVLILRISSQIPLLSEGAAALLAHHPPAIEPQAQNVRPKTMTHPVCRATTPNQLLTSEAEVSADPLRHESAVKVLTVVP